MYVIVQPGRQQLCTRQLLTQPSPSPPVGWGREMGKQGNSRVEIKTG